MNSPHSALTLPSDHRAAWMKKAGWGVFIHYLVPATTTVDEWNRSVDGIDVHSLARQLSEVKAGYLIFTVGQNSGHYCSPNQSYDSITKINPSKCSKRDLIADLAQALKPYGIRLIVYVPSMAPMEDPEALKGFECPYVKEAPMPNAPKVVTTRLETFQRHWESVLTEWSTRWGKSVHGWWVDGCYFADAMYRHTEAPNFKSFADALRAGNPESALSFATGPMPWIQSCITQTDSEEDYTNGESNVSLQVQLSPLTGTALTHELIYLGENWSAGRPRFAPDLVQALTRHILSQGAIVTWETPTDKKGIIPDDFMERLLPLKNIKPS